MTAPLPSDYGDKCRTAAEWDKFIGLREGTVAAACRTERCRFIKRKSRGRGGFQYLVPPAAIADLMAQVDVLR